MSEPAKDPAQLLQERFPKMKPVSSMPTLFTINGIGVRFYGRRQFDAATGTYITTHCLCLLYLPVLALAAYRVADAQGGGYHILGRERLSSLARNWNNIVICAALVGLLSIGVNIYTNRPEYKATQELEAAHQLLAKQEPAPAARAYAQVYHQYTVHQEDALNGLHQALEDCLASGSPKVLRTALTVYSSIREIPTRERVLPDAYARSRQQIEAWLDRQPAEAWATFQVLESLTPKQLDPATVRTELLERWMTLHPDSPEPAVVLALQYEEQGDPSKAALLLLAHADKLPAGEGQRILGQWYLREGRHTDALGLLLPYVDARLPQLHEAEKHYQMTLQNAYDLGLSDLNQGRAPGDFYTSYQAASEEEKQRMVDEYLQKAVRNNPACQRAVTSLQAAGQVVPVALDLGIAQLQNAQSQQDPRERQQELNAAEKTFLAIQETAGESDAYNLYLGQVYYWMNREEEGKALFDKLLETNARNFATLTGLAEVLRLLGQTSWSMSLLEEAYEKTTLPEEKYQVALTRSTHGGSLDDKLAWLEKADPKQPYVQIQINYCQGTKALHEGDRGNAAVSLRKAIQGYASLDRTTGNLNNQGLCYLSLFECTEDRAHLQRGIELLEEAISLEPDNTILLFNNASLLLKIGFQEVGTRVLGTSDFSEMGQLSVFSYLYDTDVELRQLQQMFRDYPSSRKAIDYLKKILILSPKNLNACQIWYALCSFLEDTSSLQQLQQKLATTPPDQLEYRVSMAVLYATQDYGKERLTNQLEISRYEKRLQEATARQLPRVQAMLHDKIAELLL